MDNLSTEIHKMKNEGDILLFMDGNGKIGLMGERVSRNGALLKEVFDECELEVLNESEKCEGKITRENRKKPSEKSAIDFVLASENVSSQIRKMKIDESCEYVLK